MISTTRLTGCRHKQPVTKVQYSVHRTFCVLTSVPRIVTAKVPIAFASKPPDQCHLMGELAESSAMGQMDITSGF